MNLIVKKEFCPLVVKPEAECFCMNLTSRTIKQVLYFCKANYERCDIYLNKRVNPVEAVPEVV